MPEVLAQPPAPQEAEAFVAVPKTAISTAEPLSHGGGRHVARDYSYVRTEILRILLVAGFLMVALIITSIFR